MTIKGNGFLNIYTVGVLEGEEGKIVSNCQRIVQKNDHMEEGVLKMQWIANFVYG